MARVRLFAGLREVAGASHVDDLPGQTVGAVLEAAVDRYGPQFAERLRRAHVWVNGDEAGSDDPVGDDDELALIPPVSGGAGVFVESPGGADLLAAVTVVLVLIAANVSEGAAWWAAAVVGVAAVWASDIAWVSTSRGHDLPLAPVMAAIVAAMAATHLLGSAGLGLAAAAAVVTTLVWGVVSDSSRPLSALAPAMLLALVAALAVGSLLAVRELFTEGTRVAGVFMVVAAVAVVVGALVDRFAHLPFGDPFSLTAFGGLVAAMLAASVWDLDLVAFLLAGLVLAGGLVSGRGMGSLLRNRKPLLAEPPPGLLGGLDGVMMAAALFYPILSLVTVG